MWLEAKRCLHVIATPMRPARTDKDRLDAHSSVAKAARGWGALIPAVPTLSHPTALLGNPSRRLGSPEGGEGIRTALGHRQVTQ